jgi:hypothetical protein
VSSAALPFIVEFGRRCIVRNAAVIGQRWKRAAGAALTILVLSAVAIGGLTLFGSEVLAAWKAPGDAEQSLVSGGTFEGLLSFDAPAVLSARFKAQMEEAEQGIRRGENGKPQSNDD